MCVLEGLQRTRAKLLNYSKLFVIDQKPDENPSGFMERRREALIKHTSFPTNPVERQLILILKGRFITQAVPNIRRKLQKQAVGPDSTLENLLRIAPSAFYNRDKEEAQKKEKAQGKDIAALQTCKVQDPQGAFTSCYRCGKSGHFRKECPGSKKKPP